MRKTYQSFYESEEKEIIWVTVHYELDPYHQNRDEQAEMWHLRVHHYQSGDITEYVSEAWMEMFDKMARLCDEEDKEYYDKWLEQTSDFHKGKIAALHVVKMLQAGYDEKKIIEELAKLVDHVYGGLIHKLEVSPPGPISINPINLTVEQLQQLIEIKSKKQ